MKRPSKSRLNLKLLVLAVTIGLLSAGGAVTFRWMIDIFQNLFWGPGSDFVRKVTGSPWYLTLLVPAAGGLIVGPVIFFLVPEAKGPGVPEIIKAVSKGQSHIRHRVTFLKALVTSLLLGTGASVGREGPIAQIGASVGSSMAQLLKIPPELHRVCLAAGTAAGIAATFNAPVAGTFFAIEIILLDIEVTYISYIMTAAIVASVFSRVFYGQFPTFMVEPFEMVSHWELGLYLILGIIAGFASICFVRLLYFSQGLFDQLKIREWLKPCLGGLLLGGIGLYLPQVMGVGYETINLALAGEMALSLAVLLLLFKMLGTALCIGSGMSGGIFAPSLFLGSALGVVMGLLADLMIPGLAVNPAYYALAGMGAMVAGTTLAPITAILTIFELTYDYHVILPLMVSCIPSSIIVRVFFGYSIYEMKLLKQGINIVRGHDITVLRHLRVDKFMSKNFETIQVSAPLMAIVDKMVASPYPHFIVLNPDREMVGVLSLRDIKSSLKNFDDLKNFVIAADLMSSQVISVNTRDSLEHAMELFESHSISLLPVTHPLNPREVVGILKKDALLQAYEERVLKDRILSDSLK